tara:strand:+ start:135 stop:722 length:588 start_codon:yes stop_codon:yes gene_type:complete
MKTIIFNNANNANNTNNTNNINNIDNTKKKREKMQNIDTSLNISIQNNIFNTNNIDSNTYQKKLLNKLYLDEDFIEKKLLISELKSKINSYKSQDIKKDFHEKCNIITFNDVVEKLIISKLKCYYCNKNLLIFFEKVRDNDQWTLDRLNNYDEHTNTNTIISCLHCNLQRRRKNSEKFKFTKQLETKQIIIKKNE